MTMDSDLPGTTLGEALDELLALGKKPPTRYHARAVLVPLGELLLAGAPADEGPVAEALGRLVPLSEAEGWLEAVGEELSLACAEHIAAVDPRYLEHPRYDFTYTVAARARLEARLRAAAELGLAPAEGLLDRVAEADRLLEPHIAGKTGPS